MIKGWIEEAQLSPPDNIELLQGMLQPKNDIDSVLVSCYCYMLQLQSLLRKKEESKELLQDLLQLKQHLLDWFKIMEDKEILKVLYFLLSVDVIYLQGYCKVNHSQAITIQRLLQKLEDYGIIQRVTERNAAINVLSAHKKVFNLTDYHFKKIQFYELTYYGRIVFEKVPYNEFLTSFEMENIGRWSEKLRKSHTEINKQVILTETEAIERIIYNTSLQPEGICYSIEWIKGQMRLLERNHRIEWKKDANEVLNLVKEKSNLPK
jgi:hypothetical protein